MRVDVARPVSTGVTEVEPARAFMQDRIKLWAFWVFVLSFGFYLANIVTWSFVLRLSPGLARMLMQAGNLDHLAASLVFGGAWLICRRWRLSMEALRRLDMITLILGCALYAVMGAYLMRLELAAGLDVAIGGYAGLLACVNSVMARAISVPSTPQRTLIGSIAAMLPLVPATLFASNGSLVMTLNVATWCARHHRHRHGRLARHLRPAIGSGARQAPRAVHARTQDRRRRHGRRLSRQPRDAAAADGDQAAAAGARG